METQWCFGGDRQGLMVQPDGPGDFPGALPLSSPPQPCRKGMIVSGWVLG